MSPQRVRPVSITLLLIVSLIWSIAAVAASGESGSFTGRWALHLPNGASWLEVRQEEGFLDGDLLWRWGSVTPAASVLMNGESLIVTRAEEKERNKDAAGKALRTHIMTSWFEFRMTGTDELMGHALVPDGDGKKYELMVFWGKRIPPLPPPPDLSKIKFGKPIALFNGKDLTGWRLIDPQSKNGFHVENGVLVNDPVQEEGKPHIHYGNLRTIQEFEDFNLKLQVNVPKGSNSGIYLRGLYEVQVLDSYGKPLDSHHMGGIYSRITPAVSAEKPADEWQDFDITLCDRHVTVILNGQTIIDNQPIDGITGGALSADEFAPGPIYLQGDHGKVLYRNMVLKPILKN